MRGVAFAVLGALGGLAAGVAGTVALGGARDPAAREAILAPPPAPEVRCVTTLRESDVEYLRDQLIAAGAPIPEPPAPAAEAPPVPSQGRRLVEAIQAAGRMTDADAAALRAELPSMSAEEQEAVLKPLFAALNASQIENQTSGPLFLD
jgi:hypothetical protein